MFATSKLLFMIILLIQVTRLKTTNLKVPEYLQDGFTCPELETMEPISGHEYPKGTDDAFSVTLYLANSKKCYYKPENMLGRIVLAPKVPGKKIMGFTIQVREGPDFKRRIGWMNKISHAQTQCDEPGSLTHQSITLRDLVQAQWYRSTLSLDGNKIMIKVTILAEDKWYSINTTVPDCETINECHSQPCQKGTCQDGINRYTCVCDHGFTGINCEKEKILCKSNPCKNGGMCKEAVSHYTCDCRGGFAGLHCEKVVDTMPPEISCPDNETLQYPEPYNPKPANATDNSGIYYIHHINRTEGDAPNITVVHTWTATDPSGNTNSCNTTYTYRDTTPPHISCPDGQTIEDPNVLPNKHATSYDSSGLNITITSTNNTSGFPPNCTVIIHWSAKDAAGNEATCDTTYTYRKRIDEALEAHCTAIKGNFSYYANSCFHLINRYYTFGWENTVSHCLRSAPQGYRGRLAQIPNQQVWSAAKAACSTGLHHGCWSAGYAIARTPSTPFDQSEWGWIDHFPNGTAIITPMELDGLIPSPSGNMNRCMVIWDKSLKDYSCYGNVYPLCEYLKEDGNFCDVNECISGPCQNGGTCVDGTNSYICHCSPDFHGTNCENKNIYS